MISRRGFFSGLLAIGALAGAGIRLPKKTEIEVEAAPSYFADPNGWTIFSNVRTSSCDLSESSLQAILDQIEDRAKRIRVQPTKMIVHPDMLERAQAVLAYRPTVFERLWWSITDTMESLA